MTVLNGGEVLARALAANGIEVLFGIPGVQLDPLFAGLHDVRDSLSIIHARHEQGAALMAFGYAHVSRRIGTLLVVPGPGFLNAATGMLTAHACNAPMLCLAGQSERMFIGSGVGVLHELANQIGIAGSFTKWAERIESPEQITHLLADALNQIRTHRPRPVYLELPSDVLRMPVQNAAPVLARQVPRLPRLDLDLVDETARRLARSRFPLIIAGGGATEASTAIKILATLLDAPVGMTENGLGTLDARDPLAFTQIGANKLWGKADVVLALGTRLYAPVYNWGWDERLEIIKVDIDSSELTRLPAPISGIHAETSEFVTALCAALPRYLQRNEGDSMPAVPADVEAFESSPRADNSAVLEDIRRECRAALEGLALPRRIVEILREEIGDDGILVSDVTQLNHAALDMHPVYKPRTYISSGYQGALGFGPCTALGVKVAKPDVPVVCLVGDGGFMYAAQELATAVQFNIAVVMLVINDGAYKNVEGILNRGYDGRAIATSLRNPDFVKFAESFGVPARRVTTPGEMQLALRELLSLNVPGLIDYQIGDIPSAFWLRFLPQVRKYVPENPFALVR